jgi:hypothetical protein
VRTLAPTPAPLLDGRRARADLRAQVARLDGALVALGGRAPARAVGSGPRLAGLAELEATRDALVAAVSDARAARAAEAEREAAARLLLERALRDPRRHKFLRVPLAALGEPGCGVYRVQPRLGLIGMLAGWWEVRLSSGCP